MSNKQVFFSSQNKNIITGVVCDLVKKEQGINITVDPIIDSVMKYVFDNHPKPHTIPQQTHLENINKIVISELLDKIKTRELKNNKIDNNNNMSIAPYNPNPFAGGNGYSQQQGGYGQQQGGYGQQQGGYGQQQGGYGQQQTLPFQQMDSSMEARSDADILLAQKIQERNSLDGVMGPPQPMHHGMTGGMNNPINSQISNYMAQNPNMQHGMQNMQHGMQNMQRGAPNVHPAVISNFLSLSPAAQRNFAMMDPMQYHHIVGAIQRMNMQYLGEKEDVTTVEPTKTDTESSHCSGDDPSVESGSDHQTEDEDEDEKHKKRNKKNGKKHHKIEIVTNKRRTQKRDYHQEPRTHVQAEYLSLDFRNDLREIDSNKYILAFTDQHNVSTIELESCLINQTDILQSEPYIYICIDEIDGDYMVSTGKNRVNVFGKLIQSKVVNGFIVYQPENCCKVFNSRKLLNQLSVSFVQYDQRKLSLTKLHVAKIGKSSDKLKIISKGPHYLSQNDKVNICTQDEGQITVNSLNILDTPDKNVIITSMPLNNNIKNPTFERVGIKCTLTFKITH